jgi:hypothetical protein
MNAAGTGGATAARAATTRTTAARTAGDREQNRSGNQSAGARRHTVHIVCLNS